MKLKSWIRLFSGLAIMTIMATVATIATANTNTVTSTVTGTTTVDKTPPTASAPSIVINNNDVCTSAASAAVQTQNCERLKLARSLYGMGMKVAAVSMLCQDERVFDAMKMAGTPCPFEGKIGEAAQAEWDKQIEEQELEEKADESTVEDSLFFTILGFLIFLL